MKHSNTTTGKKQDDETNTRTNTSPTHKMSLTLTKEHPLMDLVNIKTSSRAEFMDDSDEDLMVLMEGGQKDDAVVECEINKNNNVIIENSQISLPIQSTDAAVPDHVKNVDDEKNYNTPAITELIESDDDQKLKSIEKSQSRKKSPSRVINNVIDRNPLQM